MRYSLIEYLPESEREPYVVRLMPWPHNGAVRVYVQGDVPTRVLDPRYARLVEDQIDLRDIPLVAHDDLLGAVPDEARAPVVDPDEEAAAAGDHWHDQQRDDRLTGDA